MSIAGNFLIYIQNFNATKSTEPDGVRGGGVSPWLMSVCPTVPAYTSQMGVGKL